MEHEEEQGVESSIPPSEPAPQHPEAQEPLPDEAAEQPQDSEQPREAALSEAPPGVDPDEERLMHRHRRPDGLGR